jgi:hypothetical protein
VHSVGVIFGEHISGVFPKQHAEYVPQSSEALAGQATPFPFHSPPADEHAPNVFEVHASGLNVQHAPVDGQIPSVQSPPFHVSKSSTLHRARRVIEQVPLLVQQAPYSGSGQSPVQYA